MDVFLTWEGTTYPSHTVTLKHEPEWSQLLSNSAWSYGVANPHAAFGLLLPFQTLYYNGNGDATFDAYVYMRTVMEEDTPAERTVISGQYDVHHPADCTLTNGGTNENQYQTWYSTHPSEGVWRTTFHAGTKSGASGYSIYIQTLRVTCSNTNGATSQSFSVETKEWSDDNANDYTNINTEFAASVGVGDAYGTSAQISLSERLCQALLAYPDQGRAYLNNILGNDATKRIHAKGVLNDPMSIKKILPPAMEVRAISPAFPNPQDNMRTSFRRVNAEVRKSPRRSTYANRPRTPWKQTISF